LLEINYESIPKVAFGQPFFIPQSPEFPQITTPDFLSQEIDLAAVCGSRLALNPQSLRAIRPKPATPGVFRCVSANALAPDGDV